MSYSPERILRQFKFDQGALWIMGDTCVSIWEAESRFISETWPGGRAITRECAVQGEMY